MPEFSICVNVDSRPENSQNREMFNGCVDRDFLVEGLVNKRRLFDGLDFELVCFLDEHETVDEKTLAAMRKLCDTLIIRKHNKGFEDQSNFAAFNDLNYLTALFAGRGKYLFHFDGDVAAFAPDNSAVKEIVGMLDTYDYISYPSMWSPNPVDDPSFGGKYWCSTRFFACKRSTLNFHEILKCQLDYNYWKDTYPVPRLCHWTEHLISSISWHKGKGVYYPPIDFNKFILFTWGSYEKYTLMRLNNQTFEETKNWVMTKNYHYPCDLTI